MIWPFCTLFHTRNQTLAKLMTQQYMCCLSSNTWMIWPFCSTCQVVIVYVHSHISFYQFLAAYVHLLNLRSNWNYILYLCKFKNTFVGIYGCGWGCHWFYYRHAARMSLSRHFPYFVYCSYLKCINVRYHFACNRNRLI